ncbi:class I SAM-dependent methyltransferase [Pseudonocardia acaciae]|uniref:class I SAM-dependent methyltransferase n=1 Tax=Pseudonocardia acaciae TaxID=551276 RepID=UPI00048E5FD8|nr:class I SAM-dependent methyltransferase [Pseudonocardia acaciae]
MTGQETSGAMFYQRVAPYVAALLPAAWHALAPAVAEALREVPAGPDAPVVDIGAGTGIGTELIARTLPGADVLAIEPDPAMRTALLARVAADPDLRRRTTVEGEPIETARLPDRIAAVLAANVLGHLDAPRRARLWAVLAERLVPGGVAVVTVVPPDSPREVPEMPMSELRIGRDLLVGSAGAQPAGPDSVRWTMTYRGYRDGRLVDEVSHQSQWWVLGPDELAAEVAAHGLAGRPGAAGTGLFLIRP